MLLLVAELACRGHDLGIFGSGGSQALEVGDLIEGAWSERQSLEIAIEAEALEYLRLEIEQDRSDWKVILFDPQGEPILDLDSPDGWEEDEIISWVTMSPGLYRLRVELLEAEAVNPTYRIRCTVRRAAAYQDFLVAIAERVSNDAEQRRRRGEPAERVIETYRAAWNRWRNLGDLHRVADTRRRWGRYVFKSMGKPDEALTLVSEAREAFERLAHLPHLASTDLLLAEIHRARGEDSAEAEALRRAIPCLVRLKEQAYALNQLGELTRRVGDAHEARSALESAVEVYEQIADPEGEATARHNRGLLLLDLGHIEEAISDFSIAIEKYASLGLSSKEALSTVGLADCWARQGRLAEAAEQYRRALEVQKRLGDRRGQASSLNNMGIVFRRLGTIEAAESAYGQALGLYQELGIAVEQVRLLNNLAVLYLDRGSLDSALEVLDQAESRLQSASIPLSLRINLLQTRAGVLFELGRLTEAETIALEAIDLVEAQRSRVADEDIRSAYFEGYLDLYNVLIQILLERERQHPNQGHGLRAFELSERARARTFLDLLALQRLGIRPKSGRRSPEFEAVLHAHVAEQSRARALDEEVEELRSLWGRYAHRWQPSHEERRPQTRLESLSLEEVQQTLLDSRRVLLHYELGKTHSVVWVVTEGDISMVTLPPKSSIEDRVSRLYGELSGTGKLLADLRDHLLEDLGEDLMAPLATKIEGRSEILLSVDGALAYLPFAALPDPCRGSQVLRVPLVTHHTITRIRSASTAVYLATRSIKPKGRRLGIIAAPIFDRPAEGVGSKSPSRKPRYPALPHARQEAEDISRLLDQEDTVLALGFEARLDRLFDGSFSHVEILHIATHGESQVLFPQFSYLVFSLVDEVGQPLDGFLYAYQIADLNLAADLVVLSACGTALGRQVHGEGFLGLTRPFLLAGARQVIASLWDIQDHLAADLMIRFYHYLLDEGLMPSEALRRAQTDQWRVRPDSMGWAAFVIEGGPDGPASTGSI